MQLDKEARRIKNDVKREIRLTIFLISGIKLLILYMSIQKHI